MKPRIYISGKITGLHADEYIPKFNRTENLLRHAGLDAINPLKFGIPENASHEEAMQICFKYLWTCDAMYVLACANNGSRGAAAEIEFCQQNNIPVYYEHLNEFKKLCVHHSNIII